MHSLINTRTPPPLYVQWYISISCIDIDVLLRLMDELLLYSTCQLTNFISSDGWCRRSSSKFFIKCCCSEVVCRICLQVGNSHDECATGHDHTPFFLSPPSGNEFVSKKLVGDPLSLLVAITLFPSDKDRCGAYCLHMQRQTEMLQLVLFVKEILP